MSEATTVTGGMSARAVLLHGVLFCVAYGAFLAYQFATHASDRHLQSAVAISDRVKIAAAVIPDTLPPVAANATQQAALPPTSGATVSEAASSSSSVVTQRPPEVVIEPEIQQAIQQNILQATQAADTAERSSALNYLHDAPRTTEVFHAMATVANRDASAINRLSAITAMSQWSSDQEKRDALLAVLQQAMSDSNPRVSAKARAVYAQLAAVTE